MACRTKRSWCRTAIEAIETPRADVAGRVQDAGAPSKAARARVTVHVDRGADATNKAAMLGILLGTEAERHVDLVSDTGAVDHVMGPLVLGCVLPYATSWKMTIRSDAMLAFVFECLRIPLRPTLSLRAPLLNNPLVIGDFQIQLEFGDTEADGSTNPRLTAVEPTHYDSIMTALVESPNHSFYLKTKGQLPFRVQAALVRMQPLGHVRVYPCRVPKRRDFLWMLAFVRRLDGSRKRERTTA